MTPSELLRELHESNQRMKAIIERLRQVETRIIGPVERAELKWLAKDDDDYNTGACSGDWTK